jgi:hypothetical protein
MSTRWSLLLVLAMWIAAIPALTAENVAPRDLVGRDAALVCEIRQPRDEWEKLRQSELFQRLQRSEPYRRLLETPGYRLWQEVELHVESSTGALLSTHLLDLISEELVLVAYLSDGHRPEGVFISRAESADAVQKFLQTWQQLEPLVLPQALKHNGETYFVRPPHGPRHSHLYYATFGSVLVLSDHESRLRQVLELSTADDRPASPRLRASPELARTALASDEPPPAVRFTLPARRWDRVWQDAARSDDGAALLSQLWPALDVATLDVRPERGVHVEARLHLDADRAGRRWQEWCAALPAAAEFLPSVPASAVLVASGGLPVRPLLQFLRERASESDREEWNKGQRLARGVLGGRDLLDDVLPALTESAAIYLLPASDRDLLIPWDGVLRVRFPEKEQTTGLHLALDQALASGLTLLSVHVAERFPATDPALVRSEVREGEIIRWLETPLPTRVAYRLTPAELTVSRSVETLRKHLSSEPSAPADSVLAQARAAWFPDAGQFLAVDARGLRQQPLLQKAAWLLELCDVAYAATKFEPAQATLRLGLGIAESK